MNLTSNILPYPYEAYTKFNRQHTHGFDSYKNQIYGWVENNTSSVDIKSRIDIAFSYVEDSEYNKDIKEWLLSHIDKLRYIGDFSGLDFGLQIMEEYERVSFRYPSHISEEDIQLYQSYNENTFKEMNCINRLEWMYTYCEFIPFRIIYEDYYEDNCSHKFSHIKRDSYTMSKIKGYLENAKFQPRDEIYYFILFSPKTKSYYLKRDLCKSPK